MLDYLERCFVVARRILKTQKSGSEHNYDNVLLFAVLTKQMFQKVQSISWDFLALIDS